jgi:hypothetical protein
MKVFRRDLTDTEIADTTSKIGYARGSGGLGSAYGHCLSVASGSYGAFQIRTHYNDDVLYVRINSGSGWRDWKKIPLQSIT